MRVVSALLVLKMSYMPAKVTWLSMLKKEPRNDVMGLGTWKGVREIVIS